MLDILKFFGKRLLLLFLAILIIFGIAMVWPESESTKEMRREEFSEGYDEGYDIGYDIGYDEGYEEGFEAALENTAN